MTAEIAVLNRSAVALAADSAVTIQTKVYNSVNKLFGLSKFHPVGIMVYGSADLMGVPWDVIIKMFRQRLGPHSRPKLEEYAEELKEYLTNNKELFPDQAQRDQAVATIRDVLSGIHKEAKRRARQKSETVQHEVEVICRAANTKLGEVPYLSGYSEADIKGLAEKYAQEIANARVEVFDGVELANETQKALEAIAVLALCKAYGSDSSGVVIAGFGDKDIFPALVTFRIHHIAEDQPRLSDSGAYRVTSEQTGCVIPFAQGDLASTFMEGADRGYRDFINEAAGDLLLEDYPELVASALAQQAGLDPAELKAKLVEIGQGALDRFDTKTSEFRHSRYVAPVIRAVSVLPKEELATLAESLVNLTSLKKRVTLDVETVGGPIDVVVISKGDGLVWMKRKHYFKPELNPHFFTNYFRKETSDE